MIKDITEMLKMLLIIFLWFAGYRLSLEIATSYAHINAKCTNETQDFIPSSENTNETLYAHINRSN